MARTRPPWVLAAAGPLALLLAVLPSTAAIVFDGSGFQGLQPPRLTASTPVPGCTTSWYSQRLDHFSRHDKRRWQQRYTVCTAYWNPQAKKQAVYMYLGNESPLPGAWPTIFSDMAREEGGLLLYAEHRYYGESLPFGNRSLTNEGLAYLTVEQVLADYAKLVEAVRKSYKVPRSAPTVCYGGSYGGNLAAYLRLQYPKQFDAALASSAVVKFLMPSLPFLKAKYDAYKILTDALIDAGGDACAARVNRAFATMQGALAYTAQGRQQLATALRMCDPGALDSPEAVSGVGATIRDTWWGTFQTIYRANPTFNAAAAMCSIVNAAPDTDLGAVEGVAQAVITVSYTDDRCIPSEAAIFPFGSKDNGSNASDDPTMRAWLYQCCRQGFPVSTHLWSAYPSVYGYWAMPAQFFINWQAAVLLCSIAESPPQQAVCVIVCCGRAAEEACLCPCPLAGSWLLAVLFVTLARAPPALPSSAASPVRCIWQDAWASYSDLPGAEAELVAGSKIWSCVANGTRCRCKRVYGLKSPLQYPRQFTYTPHKLFARTSNLIFSNGAYDPWAAGSVFTDQARHVPAIMTPKASHRQDLSAAQAGNTAAFNATQRQIKAWIREWVLTPEQEH